MRFYQDFNTSLVTRSECIKIRWRISHEKIEKVDSNLNIVVGFLDKPSSIQIRSFFNSILLKIVFSIRIMNEL